MNTDQAFDLLKNAGVTDEMTIKTVRRWLRERKIKYEGPITRKSGYILNDIDQAIHLLQDAGVTASKGIPILQSWLQEGKIKNVGNGNLIIEYMSADTNRKQVVNEQNKIIRELNAKVKALEAQINGLEELHKTSVGTFIQQREQLNKKIMNLEKDKELLQSETSKLLKENIDLRKELIQLREEFFSKNRKEPEKTQDIPVQVGDYRKKLGLSKTAGNKEVLAGYKNLLKLTHPDQGGSARAFHYIKTDYDSFRSSLKES